MTKIIITAVVSAIISILSTWSVTSEYVKAACERARIQSIDKIQDRLK